MPRRQRQMGYRLAAAGLALIALLTLIPHPEEAARAAATPLSCVVCGDLGGVDFLLNILLFLPLGIGLGMAGFSWRRALVLAGLISFSVEMLQMKVIAGRDASLGDLLTNTFGGGLGAYLGGHWRGVILPGPREARRLAMAYALALGWVWAGTAWALGPTWPASGRWYGQWAADLGNMKPFLGTPLLITAGGEPLLPGRAIDQGRLEDAVAARPSMAFRAVLGAMPIALAPVGSIYDARQREVMLLGQDRQDLSFRMRMRASILRLRNPRVNLAQGMAGLPGDTVEAQGALHDGAFELSSRSGEHLRSRRLPLSASWGWSLVTPWDAAYDRGVYFLTALWIAGLVGVLAYWAVWAGRTSFVILPVTIMLMLGAIPYAAGFPPAHWSEWMAAAVGTLLGVIAAQAARAGSTRENLEEEQATP